MPISHSLVRHLSAAAAACSILAAAAPAQAGVIAIFDPAFGPAIPNLGFKGSIALDVTPGCYALGPGFQFTGGNCQITAQSAEVDFYNATQNSNTILTTVMLGASSFAPNYVFGAYFDRVTGQLAGFDTNDSSIFNVSVTDPNRSAPISYSGSMDLFFQSGFDPISPTLPSGVPGGFLENCTAVQGNNCIGSQQSNRASVTFVPEPDSIALALLGLGALAVTRRRARTASLPRR